MARLEDFDSPFENKWCPGCGNFGILKAVKTALVNLGLEPSDVLAVSGIGQAAKSPHFYQCHFFHTLHGRALPIATGAKAANHELTVLVHTGDGDCLGEGGNHFLHAVRRNLDVTVLLHNNRVYGLTKGQASPSSERGMVTKIQTHGVVEEPFNALSVALALNCGFVARGFSGQDGHLAGLIEKGVQHKGLALIDICQPCVSFNKIQTHGWYKERVYDLAETGHDPSDYKAAFELSRQWGEKIPIGILYKVERPGFVEQAWDLKKGPLAHQPHDPAPLQKALEALD